MHMDHLLKNLPGTIVFAVSEDGYLSSRYPDRTFLDLNGLHDFQMAKNGFSAEAVLSREPDLIWMPHWAYPESTKSFWKQPAFWENYEYYPRLFAYGLAIRKNSDSYEKIHQALKASVARVYPGHDLAGEQFIPPAGEFPETAASIIEQFKSHFGIISDAF